MDKGYDPNFRYASNEAAPSDWVMGEDGGMMEAMGPPTTMPGPPTTTTTSKNPIKKSGSGSSSSGSSFFDSNFGTDDGGYARSNSADGFMNNGNGQCECKSLEKSIV